MTVPYQHRDRDEEDTTVKNFRYFVARIGGAIIADFDTEQQAFDWIEEFMPNDDSPIGLEVLTARDVRGLY